MTIRGHRTQRASLDLIRALAASLVLISAASAAEPPSSRPNAEAIPHVDTRAKENFRSYQLAGKHKAFAIAPGGVWAWQADAGSPEQAERLALKTCQENTRQKCVLYALNDDVVFDREGWPRLWGPYASERNAAEAPTGSRVGERFYDLVYREADGSPTSLSAARGKILLLHFWGSWCPPCLREFPALQKLRRQLEASLGEEVQMVLLQVREPFDEARLWAEANGFTDLPLFDSGSSGSDDTDLDLAQGGAIEDRKIGRAFPSSYVLDRRGVVVFSHAGPVEDWLEYLPFFQHAVRHTETP
ncbi:MAG: redoxin family protein [Gammaproteobacteria bacterium]